MYKALRNVLGDHVMQRGSNITGERMRFDFSHNEKMTAEQIKQVEDMVNGVIQKNMPVTFVEMGKDEAFGIGALGAFGEKYPDTVKVYTVGDPSGDYYSREICGGPHVDHTGKIGKFKIVKEESSSAESKVDHGQEAALETLKIQGKESHHDKAQMADAAERHQSTEVGLNQGHHGTIENRCDPQAHYYGDHGVTF